MQQNLSAKQLNKIAKENYKILTKYCTILTDEGYWDEPYKILKKSIVEMLDLYLQSCMIHIAYSCSKNINEQELQLISNLTESNPLAISNEDGINNEIIRSAEQFLANPPILLQLVGMRDMKEDKTLGGLFFDAILNILLVIAYLSTVTAAIYMRCLKDYCLKASVFISKANNKATIVDDKYLFKKVCVQDLESSTEALKEAGEDFISFKEHTLFYREPQGVLMQQRPIHPHEKEVVVTETKQVEEEKSEELEKSEEEKTEELEKSEKLETSEEQVLEQIEKANQEERLSKLLDELNELVGLKEVKAEIHSLINLIKVKKLREKYCLPEMNMSYHMVFSGSPGTGKTTVARLVAEIYKELGLLSKGTMVETDRAGLVAGFVGQTAIKVKEVVDKAIGGVLFIDEAYALTSQMGTNDFGTEAIDTLVKLMEDNRDDLVVIVAGYTKEMKQFLSSNTGLVSRFNKFIEFKDYENDELIDILCCMAKHNGFEIAQEALDMVDTYLAQMSKTAKKSFGNARGIRNLFEKLVVQQANRVVMYDMPTKDQLSKIEVEDVEKLIS